MSQFIFTATVTSEDNLVTTKAQPFTVNAVPHVGCTVRQQDYPASVNKWDATHNYFDAAMGRTMGGNVQKVYFGPGEYPGVGGTPINTDLHNGSNTGIFDQGVRGWLCYWPAIPYTLTDAQNLVASINAFKTLNWKGKVVLLQEPQDGKKNVSASAFIAMHQQYYNYLKGPNGTSCTVVYNSASSAGEAAVGTYYPGDAYCDEVAQDLYGLTYWGTGTTTPNGVTLGTLQSLANNAKPNPKPLNWGEMGSSLSTKLPTNSQVQQYIQYAQTLFTMQVSNGYQIGDVMWYNGDNSTTQGYWNIINPGDFRIPYLQALYDALTI